jgi:hypothetical protein
VNRANSATIEAIEGVREPDPGPQASSLIRRCVGLRRKPLAEFTTEDLRIMLGQEIAVPTLLPIAVTVLADDRVHPRHEIRTEMSRHKARHSQ